MTDPKPCPGCEQGPDHVHDDAEDPPRAECCAHTCKEATHDHD